jgi:uncharacterized membrane protein YbaN (DUF454 family)
MKNSRWIFLCCGLMMIGIGISQINKLFVVGGIFFLIASIVEFVKRSQK